MMFNEVLLPMTYLDHLIVIWMSGALVALIWCMSNWINNREHAECNYPSCILALVIALMLSAVWPLTIIAIVVYHIWANKFAP